MNWTRSKRTACSRSCRSCSTWTSGRIKSLASRRLPSKELTISPTCKSARTELCRFRCTVGFLCDVVVFPENFASAGTMEAVLEVPRCYARIIFFASSSAFLTFDISKFRGSSGEFSKALSPADAIIKTMPAVFH